MKITETPSRHPKQCLREHWKKPRILLPQREVEVDLGKKMPSDLTDTEAKRVKEGGNAEDETGQPPTSQKESEWALVG